MQKDEVGWTEKGGRADASSPREPKKIGESSRV
jgi:hypothetical protein